MGGMLGSESSGYHGGSSSSDNCFDIDICPDLILAGIAAFSAAAFYSLYVAITMAGRRRKRSGGGGGYYYYNVLASFGDVLLTGL